MKKILKSTNNIDDIIKTPKIGDIINGKIIGKEMSSVFLDLGPLGAGIIYGKEFLDAKSILRDLEKGDKISAKLVDLENEDGYFELSLREAAEELNWQKLKEQKETEEIIKVIVIGANKGGLLTKISEISAFLPVSQLNSENYPKVEDGNKDKILKELQKFIGKELKVRIFDVSLKDKKLILSQKIIEAEKTKEILKKYKVGDKVEGKITGIVDFGVFIKFPLKGSDTDKLEGLIHISELDWGLIENPSQILKVGEKIKVQIIKITEDKIFLSLKALKKNPWEGITKKYKKGDKVSGKVIKFNPFGVFIEITPEIQGLIHISEFGTQGKMEEKLEQGKKYKFEITEVNPENYRIILKLIEK